MSNSSEAKTILQWLTDDRRLPLEYRVLLASSFDDAALGHPSNENGFRARCIMQFANHVQVGQLFEWREFFTKNGPLSPIPMHLRMNMRRVHKATLRDLTTLGGTGCLVIAAIVLDLYRWRLIQWDSEDGYTLSPAGRLVVDQWEVRP